MISDVFFCNELDLLFMCIQLWKLSAISYFSLPIDLFGCTSPFGRRKDRICQNLVTSMKVLKMYKEWFVNHHALNNCSNPCYFITTQVSITREEIYKLKNVTRLKIYFDEVIKHTKAYYLYEEMTLIAEVGGFIGLIRLSNIFIKTFINRMEESMNIIYCKIWK